MPWVFAAFLFLAGCVRNESAFYSKDLPEPLRPHPGALTAPVNGHERPAGFMDWRQAS